MLLQESDISPAADEELDAASKNEMAVVIAIAMMRLVRMWILRSP